MSTARPITLAGVPGSQLPSHGCVPTPACDPSRTAMYLADRDIKALGGELNLEGPNPDHPFDPDNQIQPCSIDLRISNVFWRPSRRRRLWRRLLPWRDRKSTRLNSS